MTPLLRRWKWGFILSLILWVAIIVLVAGCQLTNSPRCDSLIAQRANIEAQGWRLDCAPSFPSQGTYDGTHWFPISAWADTQHLTVWVWPDILDDPHLLKTVQHELGHILYGSDEQTAERYAYCTLDNHNGMSWNGLSFPVDCSQFQ